MLVPSPGFDTSPTSLVHQELIERVTRGSSIGILAKHWDQNLGELDLLGQHAAVIKCAFDADAAQKIDENWR
jgi:hypothetical protein